MPAKVSLGDVADYQTGFPFKSKDYCSAGTKLLRGDNIGQGSLRWGGAKFWPKDRINEAAKFALQEGDVVLAMDRPWIEAGLKYAAVSLSAGFGVGSGEVSVAASGSFGSRLILGSSGSVKLSSYG